MSTPRLTIGGVARRTGVSVKTLRFYSDEGLLPPTGRSESGYRLYSESDLIRLDLIRTLRDAGLDLATIRRVLDRDLSLADALRLRLRAVETHIGSLQQVAAALRAALRAQPGDPDEDDIRRLCAVTRLSNDERKHMIEGFFTQIAEGVPIDRDNPEVAAFMQGMLEASTPRLPEQPSREQLDAWIELSEMISDPDFVARLRAHAATFWTPGLDYGAARQAMSDAEQAARGAVERQLAPDSPEAGAIIERYVVASAAAAGRAADRAFRDEFIDRYRSYDARMQRYWELLAIINGLPPVSGPAPEWQWLIDASKAHLEA
jgi:DNA-binding transcriptional MerR regulator